MKTAILINKKNINNYENIAFKTTAHKLNINFKIICVEDLSVYIKKNSTIIYHNGVILNDIKCLIPRTGSSTTLKVMTIINAFKANNIRVLNDGNVITLMLDKFNSLSKLSANNIDVIETMLIQDQSDLANAVKILGLPVVKKSNTGSLGLGIYLAHDLKQLNDMHELSKLLDTKYYYILQKFIDHKIGEDIRVIMLGNQPVAAMKRVSNNGDFRANYTLHENAVKYELNPQIIDLCKNVMNILKCDIAGIDILETQDGYVICEVNSAPGFKGMEAINPGLNMAKLILKFANDEIKK
jgi:gamma-F420-2:alpha-L-glutamate ligase